MSTTPCVVFDAYGTLFDIAAAARSAAVGEECLAKIWPKLSTDWRVKQLEYTWLRSLMGVHADFWQVTQDALDWALEANGLDKPGLRDKLLELYRELELYPGAEKLLAKLKKEEIPVAILSNGAPEMLSDAVTKAGIGDMVDMILSAEDAGIYKPNAQVYDLVTSKFECPRSEILFISSNGWDVAGASHYGFRTVWVNRFNAPVERLPAKPGMITEDLDGLHKFARKFLRKRHSAAAQVGQTEYFENPEGLRLAYRDTKTEGPVLLCLAGLTRNMADFDFVARDFADKARILRLDTRGRGESDWDPDYLNYNLIRESRDAIALLDHLGLEKAAILGTSRGGLIAMALAAGSKQRLTGICLNDIGPEIEPEGLAFIASYLGNRPKAATYEEATENFVNSTAEKFPGVPAERWRLHTERIYYPASDGLDLRYDALLRKSIMEQSATDAIQDMWMLFDAMEGLPLGLIRGENSDILSAKTAEQMHKRRPDMIYREVPNRGHVPFLDEPDAQAVIAEFLTKLPE